MSCPNCNVAMREVQGGGFEDEHNRYWCPYCGTLRVEGADENATHIPELTKVRREP